MRRAIGERFGRLAGLRVPRTAEVTAGKDASSDANYVTAGNCGKAAAKLHNAAHILMLATTNGKHALASLRLFAQSN